MNSLIEMGKLAKEASKHIASAKTEIKNAVLKEISHQLLQNSHLILEANEKDFLQAKNSGMSEAMLDRLILKNRLEGIAKDILQIVDLPDPIGQTFEKSILPNGLVLHKERTSLGVLGVIYEARPNVTIDVSCLAIKTGNCVILRGGTETLHTNFALTLLIQDCLKKHHLPPHVIQLIQKPDRNLVKELLHLHEYVDLIIPRGGSQLHTFCRENSTIPVITGGIGVCHLFVDESANLTSSLEVIKNAKIQRPTVCNALDTLLVHQKIADSFIPHMMDELIKLNVHLKLDEKSWDVAEQFQKHSHVKLAKDQDWDTEWLSLILGVKIVESLEEAIEHIQKHSTGHSDGILTENEMHAEKFIREIDSAAVYVNASTRFTDGGQFGLGAEVAISTQKIHARGPMGLPELTSYKWVIKGNYHVRK